MSQSTPKPPTAFTPAPPSPKPSTPTPTKPKSLADVIQPFAIGGTSGCIATCVIQPLDMIKVTIQLKSEEIAMAKKAGKEVKSDVSFMGAMRDIYKMGGIKAFYKGLDSALMRQIFYTTTRLGVYKTVFEYIKNENKKKGKADLSFAQKAFCGSVGGFFGSIIGNPADLILIRIQADNRLPVEKRRNYTSFFNAFGRIVKEEGFFALWRGATPTVVRAIVINLAMLASYDEFKERINSALGRKKDELDVRLTASAMSGVLSAWACLPFDNAKTKIQKMTKNPDGTYPYKNIFDAMAKTVYNEGIMKLWVGFPTFAIRIAPHTLITLVCQDFLTDFVTSYRKKKH